MGFNWGGDIYEMLVYNEGLSHENRVNWDLFKYKIQYILENEKFITYIYIY